MTGLNDYRQIIQDLLTGLYHDNQSSLKSGVESQLVFDSEHDHYLLLDVGWEQKQFVYGTIIHIDIKNEKIWIQQNNTEINLAERLVEQGICKQDIVLGLHSPFMRQVSGYAVS